MYLGSVLLSAVIFAAVSVVTSLIYIKISKKDFFGGTKIAVLVGVIGGFVGGFMFDILFNVTPLYRLINVPYVRYLLVNQFDINFIAVVLGICLFLWAYGFASEHTERS